MFHSFNNTIKDCKRVIEGRREGDRGGGQREKESVFIGHNFDHIKVFIWLWENEKMSQYTCVQRSMEKTIER